MAILVFGIGQLVLPSIAEHVARDRLAKYGRVLSVSVSAFPAIELVFGDADDVSVHMASYRAPQNQVASSIDEAAGVANLHASIDQVTSGGLEVSDVSVVKHGAQLTGRGDISEANLRRAIPLLASVTPVGNQDGAVVLEGTTRSLPVIGSISADVRVGAQGGKVVVSGTGLVTSFIHITAWSDPRVRVEALSGRRSADGLALSARAALH